MGGPFRKAGPREDRGALSIRHRQRLARWEFSLVVKSPRKLQTLGRMGIAFVVTVLLFIVPGAILRRGDPQALGAISGLVALLVAVIAGWWHTRAFKRGSTETSERPDAKP